MPGSGLVDSRVIGGIFLGNHLKFVDLEACFGDSFGILEMIGKDCPIGCVRNLYTQIRSEERRVGKEC